MIGTMVQKLSPSKPTLPPLAALAVIMVVVLAIAVGSRPVQAKKLYWFIPDGMRADTNLFTVYQLAREGKLPNIKKMMDRGSYGYSIPVFPSHTPVNFAALLTGSSPKVNGVSDGPMRIEGKTLEKPAVGGFSSAAKKVSPIWTVLENVGKKVALLSIPGSTPPELKHGVTIRGRWGNWGSDDAALVFEPKEKQAELKSVGAGFRLFYFGDSLTKFVETKTAAPTELTSYSPIKEAKLSAHGLDLFAFIYASTTSGKYDRIAFSWGEDKPAFVTMSQGDWSGWYPVTLKFQSSPYASDLKLRVIKIWDDGKFRIRILYNDLNKFVTDPSSVAKEMTDALGPMVDFVDNFPPQLIFEPEDKQTFLDESQMSLDWHKAATNYVFNKYQPDVFLQDIYTPNQMLTSRWWMRYIDPKSPDYTKATAEGAMADVLKMYQGLDGIVGEALKHDDGQTLFVLSSDHGIVLQRRVMALNNLFADKGWLKAGVDPVTGEANIDWAGSKVIYLQTNNIYINPAGLAGPYKRSSGADYETLRSQVIDAVKSLTDTDGTKPVVQAIPWEQTPNFTELPVGRIGDVILEIEPGYGFSEGVNETHQVLYDSVTSGNKQAYDPTTDGMQTPFVIMGPGVKAGYQLPASISHLDQMPTILKLLGVEIPSYVEGHTLNQILR